MRHLKKAKLKKPLLIALILPCMLFLSSCLVLNEGHINMPLAGNKGEVKGNVLAGSDGFTAQGSYCIDSHLVVLGGLSSSADYTVEIPNTLMNMLDIGAGYYERISKYGRFEVIGGVGYGNLICQGDYISNFSGKNYGTNEFANVFHFFGQGDIGMVRKNVELGFGIRVSDLIVRGNTTYTSSYGGKILSISNEKISAAPLTVEPCFMLAVGSKNLKWHLSISAAKIILSSESLNRYEYSDWPIYNWPIMVTTGLTFNVFKKKD